MTADGQRDRAIDRQTNTKVHTLARSHICTNAHIIKQTHTHANTHKHTHKHTHMHTITHTHTHTHIYSYTYTLLHGSDEQFHSLIIIIYFKTRCVRMKAVLYRLINFNTEFAKFSPTNFIRTNLPRVEYYTQKRYSFKFTIFMFIVLF